MAYAGLALVTGYLVWDEKPLRPPMTMAALAPAFPEAEKSNAVLKRYYFNEPASKNFKWLGFVFGGNPKQEKIWRELLATRRREIEANWSALAPVRAWVDELNDFERIADLDENPLEWNGINFQVANLYAQNAMAIAGLRALDGQGDAALLGLMPLLEVGGKPEVAARGFWVFWAGHIMQDCAVLAANFVLETAPVSAPIRARFAAVLAARVGPEGLRRVYAIQQTVVAEASTSWGHPSLHWGDPVIDFIVRPLAWLSPVVFNRHTTLNRWDRVFADLTELAVRRDIAGSEQRLADFMTAESQASFKNVGEVWFSWMINDNFSLMKNHRTIEQFYWATEDRCAALLQRLQQPERK